MELFFPIIHTICHDRVISCADIHIYLYHLMIGSQEIRVEIWIMVVFTLYTPASISFRPQQLKNEFSRR